MNRKKALFSVSLLLALFSFSAVARLASASVNRTDFRNAMRKLWEDHITWTRLYIVSAAADLPEKDATAKRLLQNQVDIGNAVKPFYGDDAGNKLAALLKDHILISTEVIDAVKAADTTKQEKASKRWYANPFG